MSVLETLHEQRNAIYTLAQKNHIEKISVFGSCARQQEMPDSDIDFLVDFMEGATLLDHVHMIYDLENLLKCKVDVVSRRGLHPYIRKQILTEALPL